MTTYTTNLRFSKPAVGEANWGTTLNSGVMDLVDAALTGVDVDMSSGTVTLSQVDGGADTGARSLLLRLTGTYGSSAILLVPNIPKVYVIDNQTNVSVTVRTSIGTATAGIPTNRQAIFICDGNDRVKYANTFIDAEGGGFNNASIHQCTITTSAVGATTLTIGESITETVYDMGAGTDLDPSNGTIQTKTLSTSETWTESLASGQSMTVQVTGANTHTITFPTLTWVGPYGNTPPASFSGSDVIVFWKISTVLYASYTGSFA